MTVYTSPIAATEAEARTVLVSLARLIDEPGMDRASKTTVALYASMFCPDPYRIFTEELVPAVRLGDAGAMAAALRRLCGGES